MITIILVYIRVKVKMTDIEFEQIIIKTIYANPEVSGKIIPELDTGWCYT